MRIGELARRASVTPDTIRYYERRGLLASPQRTPSGYRDFGAEAEADLVFIRKAQALGLRLDEIAEILAIAAGGRAPCDHVRATVRHRLADVDHRIDELRTLRSTLESTLARLDRVGTPPTACRCAAIEMDS